MVLSLTLLSACFNSDQPDQQATELSYSKMSGVLSGPSDTLSKFAADQATHPLKPEFGPIESTNPDEPRMTVVFTDGTNLKDTPAFFKAALDAGLWYEFTTETQSTVGTGSMTITENSMSTETKANTTAD